MKQYPLVTIGEILVDLTQTGLSPAGVPVLAANPGGAPANVAVAAARLGVKTAFIGRVGRDAFGDQLRRTLEKDGVDTTGLSADGSVHTTLAVVTVDASGERSFAFYRDPGADVMLTIKDIPGHLLNGTALLHFGSVSLTADPSRSTVLSAVEHARRQGALISYDPNYRPALWPDREMAVQEIRRPLSMVDILKISDEETELLSGQAAPEAAAAALQAQGVRLVLVTLGARGVYYRFGDASGLVPGFSVQVADTNGAGDTFFGAFLSRLALRPQLLDGLAQQELEQMLRFANAAAAVTTSRSGAIPAMPTLSEAEGMLYD